MGRFANWAGPQEVVAGYRHAIEDRAAESRPAEDRASEEKAAPGDAATL